MTSPPSLAYRHMLKLGCPNMPTLRMAYTSMMTSPCTRYAPAPQHWIRASLLYTPAWSMPQSSRQAAQHRPSYQLLPRSATLPRARPSTPSAGRRDITHFLLLFFTSLLRALRLAFRIEESHTVAAERGFMHGRATNGQSKGDAKGCVCFLVFGMHFFVMGIDSAAGMLSSLHGGREGRMA